MAGRRKGLSLTYKFLVMIFMVSIIPIAFLSLSSFGTYESIKGQYFKSMEDVKEISRQETSEARREARRSTRQELLKIAKQNLNETRDDKLQKYSQILASVEAQAEVTSNYIERNWQYLDNDRETPFDGTKWRGPNNTKTYADQHPAQWNRLMQVGPLLQEMDNQNDLVSLAYFSTPEANLIISKNLSDALPKPFTATERPWYMGASEEGETVWTDAYVDANTKTLTTTVASPSYNNNGSLIGVIGFDVTLSTLQEDILNTDMEAEDGFAFLVNPEGEAILYPGMKAPNQSRFGERVFEGTNLLTGNVSNSLNNIAVRMVEQKKGLQLVSIEDTSYFISYGPLETNEWSVGLAVPLSSITAPAKQLEGSIEMRMDSMSRQIDQEIDVIRDNVDEQIGQEMLFHLAVIVVVFLLIILSAYYFAKKITGPIIQLQEKAESISKGGIGKEVEIRTGDEIEELAEAFNRVIRTIKILQARDAPAGEIGGGEGEGPVDEDEEV